EATQAVQAILTGCDRRPLLEVADDGPALARCVAIDDLGEYATNPRLDLVRGSRRLSDLVREIAVQPFSAACQHRAQQLVLAAEVAIEGLIGRTRFGHDVRHAGHMGRRALSDPQGGIEDGLHLSLGIAAPLGQCALYRGENGRLRVLTSGFRYRHPEPPKWT